jgi:hypothetical protein
VSCTGPRADLPRNCFDKLRGIERYCYLDTHLLGAALSMASTAWRRAGDESCNLNAIFMVHELSFDTKWS